jgi:hypothetical protein
MNAVTDYASACSNDVVIDGQSRSGPTLIAANSDTIGLRSHFQLLKMARTAWPLRRGTRMATQPARTTPSLTGSVEGRIEELPGIFSC